VRRSAEHLHGLIDGLLDISKIEAGRLELQRDEIRTGSMLDQVVEMFRLQADAKGLTFLHETSPRLPAVVRTDDKRLRQILINLLSNAIKFTSRGSIALRVRYGGEVAEFEVTDTGIGIAPGDLERIFRPFERVYTPGAPATQGTGLGLAITKLLAEILGGEITVTSTPGQGTSFRVRLWLPEVRSPRLREPVEQSVFGYDGPTRSILIVDDDADHRAFLTELLVPLGFRVSVASDGPSCLDRLKRERFDLLLLDISMPGMDGWNVARRLRDLVPRRPRIVIVSASATPESRPRGEVDLHDAMLAKPVDLKVLLDTLGNLLDLEWQLGDGPGTIPGVPQQRIDLDPLVLEELVSLGRIGHVKAIEQVLDALEGNGGPTVEVGRLRRLIRDFDLAGFVGALEDLRQ